MKDFYLFAGEHPILTFFLVAVIGETLVRLAHAIVIGPLDLVLKYYSGKRNSYPPPFVNMNADDN
jgi:hypothetical protein